MKFGQAILLDASILFDFMQKYFKYRNAWRFDEAPHKETKLEEAKTKALLKHGGLLVRNTFDFDTTSHTHFWYVIKDCFNDMVELRPRVRNKIRHAEKAFLYQRISDDLLIENGYPIMAETYSDHIVSDRKMNKTIFLQYIENCCQNHYDFWGIFERESKELVGFCCVKLWEDSCEYDQSGVFSRYKSNATYPYYGLFHSMNRYYLQELAFRYVSDGSRTITEHSQIQDFLIQNFKFRKAYCQLAVHYKWWVKIAVKMLYPFRKIISFPRVKAILNMEAMQRGEK